MKENYVMDYETISNCFIACFIHYKTNKQHVFVIHEKRNDICSLIEFYEKNIADKSFHISFNGLGFDAQITELIIRNKDYFKTMGGEELAEKIYSFAQHTIRLSDKNEFLTYAPFDLSIKQLDLYRLHHWNNAAKRSSLKWIMYSMDSLNIQEMPFDHTDRVINKKDLDLIIEYCLNDVIETKRILDISGNDIQLRFDLSKQFNIKMYSDSEPTISKKIFLKFLSEKLNTDEKTLKRRKTIRKSIVVKDILLDYYNFTNPDFQKIYKRFESLIIDPFKTKGVIDFVLNYKDCKTKFGLGGIHGAAESGIYKSDHKYILKSADVKSYYPNLAIQNNWSPGHIDQKVFCEQYKWFYDERLKIPKSNPLNYTFKIILNSTYGLSNEINSPFYDPELTMRIK
jgi:hypothetical protein